MIGPRILLALACAACCAAAADLEIAESHPGGAVPRYEVYELTLTHQGDYPYPNDDVAIEAVFRAPSGKTLRSGGFYYGPHTWMVRFAPAETGRYAWKVTFRAPAGQYRRSGKFTAAPSKRTGFLRVHPASPYRFITEHPAENFYPLGIQQGYASKMPLQLFLPQTTGSKMVGSEEWFDTYSRAGFNFYRGNGEAAVDIVKFNVDGSGKNLYEAERGRMRDEMVMTAHRHGWKILWAPMAAPNDYVKGFDLSDPAAKAALMNVYRYNINRFGAYIDIWELMNENGGAKVVPRGFYDAAAGFLRANDPYQHPITTSYEHPAPHPLLAMAAPHAYFNCTDLELDREFTSGTAAVKSKLPGQPVLWGEIGNRCPLPDNDPANERYRILLWSAFFNESFLVPWNSPFGNGKPCTKGLSNLYLGERQREHAFAFFRFIAGVDPLARQTAASVAPAAEVRAYILASPRMIGGYLIHTTSHSELIGNAAIAVRVPKAGMRGQWINPSTGAVIGEFTTAAGEQSITAPPFAADVAFVIR